MGLDYKTLTLEDIEMYSFFIFECDGDKKKIVAKKKRLEDE